MKKARKEENGADSEGEEILEEEEVEDEDEEEELAEGEEDEIEGEGEVFFLRSVLCQKVLILIVIYQYLAVVINVLFFFLQKMMRKTWRERKGWTKRTRTHNSDSCQ